MKNQNEGINGFIENVRNSSDFKLLEELVSGKFCEIYSVSNIRDLRIADPQDNRLDLRHDSEFMLSVERHLRGLLKTKMALLDGELKMLQFPANLRVLTPPRAREFSTKPYSTSKFHCDCWSGAPLDSYNFYLVLYSDESAPSLKLFNVNEGDSYIQNYRGEYDSAPSLTVLDERTVANSGDFAAFATHTPHKTDTGSEGLRISLDFRARVQRFGDTGMVDTLRKEIMNGSCQKALGSMNSRGIYWHYSDKSFRELSEKIEQELKFAKEISHQYFEERLKYIQANYQDASNKSAQSRKFLT